MSCSTCKNKDKINFINSEADKVQKKMMIWLSLLGVAGIYGLINLILKALTLF
jgi:hypothetical protein